MKIPNVSVYVLTAHIQKIKKGDPVLGPTPKFAGITVVLVQLIPMRCCPVRTDNFEALLPENTVGLKDFYVFHAELLYLENLNTGQTIKRQERGRVNTQVNNFDQGAADNRIPFANSGQLTDNVQI